MRLHIFTRESDYSNKFLAFLESHFNIANDIFVFRLRRGNYKYSEGLSDKILFIDTKYKLIFSLLPKLFKSDTIFYHYFPVGLSLFFWFFCLPILKTRKVIWSIWGGDLYFHKIKHKNIKVFVFDWLRARIIRRVDIIICPVKGDFELAREFYETKAKYHYAFYPLPIDLNYLESIKRRSYYQKKEYSILIGNSASLENNHIEIFEKLKTYKDENIKIVCPLSYGITESVQEIVQYGNRIFGEKFSPILDLLTQEEYAKVLSNIDVAIMNHERQQGLGTIFILLLLGKKVYLRSDVTSFSYLKGLGVKVYDTKTIYDNDLKGILSYDDLIRENNYQIIKKEISISKNLRLWSEIIT